MDFSRYLIDKEFILNTHNNSVYNKVLIDYYKRLIKEGSDTSKFSGNKYGIPLDKIYRLDSCNKLWNIDIYKVNQIKDFISTNLCHDKFCNNCKKVRQACRMSRYIPYIEPYKENLYHITFTIPNISGEYLKETIKKLSLSFRKLMRYVRGNLKIRGLDFSHYGYKGAIRSLEITFKENNYHPHLHCAFVFENLDISNKIYKNIFSYDRVGEREDRLFSEFEIFIQKIWYLIYNDLEVTKKNIDKLDLGYSCIIDKFYNEDYMELFKYMTKETDEEDNILTYSNFKTLYLSTYRYKQIQGYGCFYLIKDSEDLSEEVDKVYADIKELLLKEEMPTNENITPFSLLNDNEYKVISRKKIYEYINK